MTAADPAELERSLGASTGERVVRRETHCSVVLLVGDRVFKLKKPVRFDFVDQRSLVARRDACRHELAVNRAMAPGIGRVVRSVVPDHGSYALSDVNDPEALDYVVEMRRFDEQQTMRALADRGALTRAHAVRAGAAIAGFHARAARVDAAVPAGVLAQANLEALTALVTDADALELIRKLRRFDDAFVEGFGPVLDGRARAGMIVDGHGDLRAEHIVFDDGGVLAVDRLEWDDLRRVDVVDDLAFLAMDLESHGHGAFVSALLDGYVGAGGAHPPRRLLAYYGSYRAQVRAKVAWLRAAQQPQPEIETGHGLRLLELARRLAWRARGSVTLLVTGPPASGKSTLAQALGRASGLPVLSSDDHRPRDESGRADYAPSARAAVYRELGAEAACRTGAIVDATFGEPSLREAFTRAVAGRVELLVVECRAPDDLRRRRARERATAGVSASDAGEEVASRLGARFSTTATAGGPEGLIVNTERPLAVQVDDVEAWLDAGLAWSGGE